jgi:FkbM family methyltransferase
MTPKKALQDLALGTYNLVSRTGILDTALGRRLFLGSYAAYKNAFEGRQIRALRPYVPADTCVIDVGANVGFYTRHFARWVAGSGRVIAIEPDHDNFMQLRRTLERGGGSAVTQLIEAAAAESSGPLRLQRNPVHPGDHRIAEDGIEIPGCSIDDVLQGLHWPAVSLIKIDVQGAELRVLRGARQTLQRFRPALFVEIDDQALNRSGATAAQLLRELSDLGYRAYGLAADGAAVPLDEAAIAQRRAELGYADFLFLARPAA